MVVDVSKILYEICEDENVYQPDFDLMDSGLLDSFALIELLNALEDQGVTIQLTRIDRNRLRTPREIQKLIEEVLSEKT